MSSMQRAVMWPAAIHEESIAGCPDPANKERRWRGVGVNDDFFLCATGTATLPPVVCAYWDKNTFKTALRTAPTFAEIKVAMHFVPGTLEFPDDVDITASLGATYLQRSTPKAGWGITFMEVRFGSCVSTKGRVIKGTPSELGSEMFVLINTSPELDLTLLLSCDRCGGMSAKLCAFWSSSAFQLADNESEMLNTMHFVGPHIPSSLVATKRIPGYLSIHSSLASWFSLILPLE